MVAPNAEPMAMETRLSMQSDISTDDDEYALAALGISGAGYTPAGRTTLRDPLPQSGPSVAPPRPLSTTKPRYDTFALRHDGDMGTAASRPVAAGSASPFVSSDDSLSTRSSDEISRPESVYQGPSVPSHPYQMYPQQARLARTASIATTSTAQVSEMSYTGPIGGTMVHPNRGDPQYMGPTPSTSQRDAFMPSAPVVGFPGRNNNYQRRLGPDGEEIADLIGPDGHTEQLPPYTQYADEALARKTRPHIQTVVPGAGGMGLATRNPEFASREDLSSPQSQQSTSPSIMSDRNLDVTSPEVTEKPKLKKWQQVARRKVCGIIPIWAFLLIALCFFIFGIILGTVLAALKPPHKVKKQSPYRNNNQSIPQEVVTTTEITMTTVDASPFQTFPTGIAPLPTGNFILPATVPTVALSSCVNDSSKNFAWGCQIQPFLDYQVSISTIPGKDPLSNYQINLEFNEEPANLLPYGAQPPVLSRAQGLRLVNDSLNTDRGPAWFFQTIYDKLVILPEGAFTPIPVSKRHTGQQGRGNVPASSKEEFLSRKSFAQPGDKPWFCYWNCTLLETFIYVNQTNWSGFKPSSPSGALSVPTGTGSTTAAPSVPTQSRSPSGSANLGPPFYPKLVKLEERRVAIGGKGIAPYCVQQIINPDGTYQPDLDATGNQKTIVLGELDPLPRPTMQGREEALTNFKPRAPVKAENETACGCLWLV